jgi:hypothetical protein
MPKEVEPRFTENVTKTFDVYVDHPELIRDLHEVLARLYETAGVHLTRAEKAALLIVIGKAIAKGVGPGGKN